MTPIYLDYNATTPIDTAVFEAMRPFLGASDSSPLGNFGNPSSTHSQGRTAREAVDRAREQVARLLGASHEEVVFTGGGSEASNQAIKGVFFSQFSGILGRLFRRDFHLITTTVEHPATRQPCAFLERLGAKVTVVPVDRHGQVDPEAIARAFTSRTRLVTVMHSNNEVGTLQPIREIVRRARPRGILVHTDAAQSLGKVSVDVEDLGVDLLTVAGHKVYAPKGVGALYVRRNTPLEPLIHGAGHEGGRRAGTENVAALVALGQACALAHASLPAATTRLRKLRDRLWDLLRDGLGSRISLNGHPEERLPNTLNVNFPVTSGADLLQATPEVAASTGSACHEGSVCLSPVLQAMGVPPDLGRGAVRLSVGRFTTEAEVEQAAERLLAAVKNAQ